MNRNDTAPNVGRLFFPQSQSLGVDQGSYSPHVLRQIVYAGVQNTSFAAGRDDLLNLARLKISEKQVERATERIGQERVEQRGAQVQAFLKLPVMEKFAAAVAHPPDLAVVEMDGGRLQIRNEKRSDPTITGVASPVEEVGLAVEATLGQAVAEPAVAVEATPGQAVAGPSASETRNHWREDKIGLLMTMTSKESAGDPCPTIPETFVNPLRIIKLARELHKGCAPSEGAVADPSDPEKDNPLECPEYIPPTVLVKSMVATRQDAESLGKTLAAAARSRGFYGAKRKAFVADGAECNWTVQKRWFSDFVPIIDFIHALSYVFAAATAGRLFGQGWAVYVRWIGLVWQGSVAEVITELERRQEELGLPTKDESETNPRRVVADTLRYLKNNQGRMKYDEYRRLGLPITSSHVESTVKQFNRRVKGTEKFWLEEGAEALLQLRADYLSETETMEKFWQEREAAATGRRCYRRAS
ncbi:MAG TPA: hypothetical protein VN203_23745 [Candidatus Acidoferrum sp.]|nr:hypothetical protein [Candidatus Methylomirabilis sp.]HWU40672.1 hypothetical protein [Candidatus Acidoferrum sp.]